MRVYLLSRTRLTRGGVILAMFVFGLILAVQARGMQRRLFGVKEGVTLEDRIVSGLLPEEVARLVKKISSPYEREARNAMYFPETGQVILEQNGVTVDVAGTVQAICGAKRRTHLHLVTRSLPAAIPRDFFTPVFRGSTERNEVALTFNVAWGEESMPGLLEALKKEGIHASFFFVGDWARRFPELVQAVARAGHEIANHGLYHGRTLSLSRTELTRLIEDNHALLAKITGAQPAPLFAPPAGECDQRTVGTAAELGYRTVLWTVDTVDWKCPAPDLIQARVCEKVCRGAIILMHPTAPTVAALPGTIKALRGGGYRLVTVGRLLR